jgi:hypothetical protein
MGQYEKTSEDGKTTPTASNKEEKLAASQWGRLANLLLYTRGNSSL